MYCTHCGARRPDAADANFCPSCGTAFAGADGGPAVRYASWGSRLGAYLLDGLFQTLFAMPLLVVLAVQAVHGGVHLSYRGHSFISFPVHDRFGRARTAHLHFSTAFIEAAAVVALAWLMITLLYGGLLMQRERHNGQTWGKQAVGIRVVRDSGEPFTFWRGVQREGLIKGLLVGAISNVPYAGGIASLVWYLWPLWDRTNRAPHDMIVKSHVVRAQA